MKKVIVIGANSFIGRHLCQYLSEHKYFVYAVVRQNCSYLAELKCLKNIEIVYSEMEEYGNLDNHIRKKCDIGILLSWSGVRGQDRDNAEIQQKNVKNLKAAVYALDRIGCSTIVSSGSQAEYGLNTTQEKVSEKDICRPNTEYGKAKLLFYQWLEKYCHEKGKRFLEPRYFSLYGEDDYEGTLILSVIKRMLKNQPCDLTECKQIWDFMYIHDAVVALCVLLETPEAEGVFNFGSGQSRPLKEYVEKMREQTQSNSPLHYGKIPYPKTGIVHINPDISKLLLYVGHASRISFEEGIQRIIQKYEKEN